MKKLRFVARGSALVPNFELQEARVKAFVGRKWTEIKPTDPAAAALASMGLMDLDGPSRWAFVSTNEPDAVPYRAEYVKACKDGDLWPADEETAKVCGVKFDPKFRAETAPTDAPPADGEEV